MVIQLFCRTEVVISETLDLSALVSSDFKGDFPYRAGHGQHLPPQNNITGLCFLNVTQITRADAR
jgi:hypothetical protein